LVRYRRLLLGGRVFIADFFRAVLAFFGTAGSGFPVCIAAWNAAQRFLVAATMAFRPSAESFRLGFEGSRVAFDGCLALFAGEFFATPGDACKLTAFFARVIAAFALRSSSWISGALTEDRSVNFDINASILAIRLRILLDFMTAPVHVHSADLRRRRAHRPHEFDFRFQPISARRADQQML
jgi:hypothetical protein